MGKVVKKAVKAVTSVFSKPKAPRPQQAQAAARPTSAPVRDQAGQMQQRRRGGGGRARTILSDNDSLG